MQRRFIVQADVPDYMAGTEAEEAIREMIQLGRSKLAGATKDLVAVRYLEVKIKNVEIDTNVTAREVDA
jgi:hypothetical protein